MKTILLEVIVKPKSRIESCVQDEKRVFHIHTKEPAQENKANFDIIRILSNHLKVPQRSLRFKSGLSSKVKIIELQSE